MHDNQITDATDVGIVDAGGAGCRIENNVVRAATRHAFAGIAVHNFPAAGDGDHTDCVVAGNDIQSAPNLMAFGLSIGMHPWYADRQTRGGTVRDNRVSGAIVNIQVDGVEGVLVRGNAASQPQGTPMCGGAPADYTVAHAVSSTLDPGWIERTYDNCIP